MKWIGRKNLDENRLDENWAHDSTYNDRHCTNAKYSDTQTRFRNKNKNIYCRIQGNTKLYKLNGWPSPIFFNIYSIILSEYIKHRFTQIYVIHKFGPNHIFCLNKLLICFNLHNIYNIYLLSFM